MATLVNQPLNNNLQYTLNSQMGAGDTSLTLNTAVTGIVQAPGVCVIDRVDSSGNKTASVREYVSFTGVSGSSLTGLVRGLAGSTAQAHNVGAIVEFVPDVTWANAIYNVITQEHGVTGQHTSLASVSGINTLSLVVPSQASIQQANLVNLYASNASINNLFVGQLSTASIQTLAVSNALIASGASLQGFTFRPAWFLGGTLSGASAQLGSPVAMPHAGTIQYAYVTTRIGASNASLGFDIFKNGTSVIAGSNVLAVPVNGTYVSTASIATKGFNSGDVLAVGTLNANSMAQDATVVVICR